MPTSYELVVIGSGVAGKRVALACREAGWSVAIIDERDFGGTCALRGCDPKKVLVHAAHVLDQFKRLQGKGLTAESLQLQWADLMSFKSTFVSDTPSQTEHELINAGVEILHGTARFADEDMLSVDEKELRFERAVIATGATPRELDIPGEEQLTYSDELLEWPALPKKIVFIGGGYISFEFAQLTARAGADVIILETEDRVLGNFDSDVVDRLTKATEDLGVEIRTGVNIKEITQEDDGLAVQVEAGLPIKGNAIVHGAGRVPAIQSLDPGSANIELSKFELSLNDHLQSTTNSRIYAAGDAAGRNRPLTPVASKEASALIQYLLEKGSPDTYYSNVPSVVYTTPRMARVGMTEEEAEQKGLSYRVKQEDVEKWFSARHRGESAAYVKTVVDDNNDTLLGAHLLYPQAEELINLFALAIQQKMTVGEFRDVIYAYPSCSSDAAAMLP